jgi:hypothetical protein
LVTTGFHPAPFGFGVQFRKPIIETEIKGAQETLFYCLDELRLADTATYDIVPEFLKRWGDQAKRVGVRLYGDSTGGNRGQQTAESNWEIIRALLGQAGIRVEYCVERNPLETDRINAVNAQFMTGEGVGIVIDHARCPYLVRDLQSVAYKEGTNQVDKTRDASITHLSDALGYPIVSLRKRASAPDASDLTARYAGFMQT